jgi:hypothetical protein
MTQKDHFQVGAKLIGLYFLMLALPIFLGIFPMVIAVTSSSPKVSDQFGVQHLPLFASPILVAVLGLYLLKSHRLVHRVFFEDGQHIRTSGLPEYFTVGAKLYGVFLIVGTLPTFLKLLGNFLFAFNYLSDMTTGEAGLRINFVPDLAMIGFGLFLLLKGEVITLWAFPSGKADDTEDG